MLSKKIQKPINPPKVLTGHNDEFKNNFKKHIKECVEEAKVNNPTQATSLCANVNDLMKTGAGGFCEIKAALYDLLVEGFLYSITRGKNGYILKTTREDTLPPGILNWKDEVTLENYFTIYRAQC